MSNVNFTYTNEPGTSRRRARRIIIDNPSNGTPVVTFETEDRIIMLDGKETFVPQESVIVPIDMQLFTTMFSKVDIETGKESKTKRSGAEIMKVIMPALTDVFVGVSKQLLENLKDEEPPIIPEEQEPEAVPPEVIQLHLSEA